MAAPARLCTGLMTVKEGNHTQPQDLSHVKNKQARLAMANVVPIDDPHWPLTQGEVLYQGQTRTPKPKNRTNSTKQFSEQFDGVAGHYPVKQGFEANRTRKFTRKFGKIFVAHVLWGTFLSLIVVKRPFPCFFGTIFDKLTYILKCIYIFTYMYMLLELFGPASYQTLSFQLFYRENGPAFVALIFLIFVLWGLGKLQSYTTRG